LHYAFRFDRSHLVHGEHNTPPGMEQTVSRKPSHKPDVRLAILFDLLVKQWYAGDMSTLYRLLKRSRSQIQAYRAGELTLTPLVLSRLMNSREHAQRRYQVMTDRMMARAIAYREKAEHNMVMGDATCRELAALVSFEASTIERTRQHGYRPAKAGKERPASDGPAGASGRLFSQTPVERLNAATGGRKEPPKRL
jgi:hypothetical protein